MSDQVSVIRWEEPSPSRAHGAGSGAPRGGRYAALADELRAHPGRWALIAEATQYSAHSIASRIREARMRCFEPRGDFDACIRKADGVVRVYARYVGDPEAGDG